MDLGTDQVYQFFLDVDTGKLAPALPPTVARPRGMVFHPSKPICYVTCELSGSVVVCRVTEQGLEVAQEAKAYPDGFTCEGQAANLGKASFWGSEATCTTSHLYYICRVHQSLAIFTIFTDGSLELTGRAALHSDSNARNLTLSGRHILVASQDASAVEVFALAGAPEGSSLERTCSEHSPCATDVAIV